MHSIPRERTRLADLEALGKFARPLAAGWPELDVPRNLGFCLEFRGLIAHGWHNLANTGPPPT